MVNVDINRKQETVSYMESYIELYGESENGDMGYLVPSNEPDMAASLIVDLSKKQNLLIEKCELTRLKATQRHKKDVIIQSLLKGYQAISLL